MVINDFSRDIKTLQEKEGMTQTELAKKLGVAQKNISVAISREQFNPTFTRILETLGYDIKVVYVKRDNL